MNSCNLIGNIGKELELMGLSSGNVVKFPLAVAGTKKDETDWINVVAFGKTAETIHSYCKKGDKLGVTGRIKTGSYTNNQGQKVYTFEVIVDRITFIEKKQNQPQAPQQNYYQQPQQQYGYAQTAPIRDEDLPF